jgi:hypothetical protein
MGEDRQLEKELVELIKGARTEAAEHKHRDAARDDGVRDARHGRAVLTIMQPGARTLEVQVR